MYCGTRSLERQLLSRPFTAMSSGDVLIKGGSPGHARLLVNMAEDGALSPWYRLSAGDGMIPTPKWTFTINQLRTWTRNPEN